MNGSKKPAKKAPAKVGAAKRLNKVPRVVREAWQLSESEKNRFVTIYGLDRVFDQLHPNAHPEDREVLFNGIAAAVSLHNFSNIIDEMIFDDAMDDLRGELEHARIGFELAMQALDRLLNDRGIALNRPSEAGKKRAENDPISKALLEIKDEWIKEGRPNRNFMGRMLIKYQQMHQYQKNGQGVSYGGLKNAMAAWKAEWKEEQEGGKSSS